MCIWKLNQFTRKVQTFLKRNIANYSYKLDFSSIKTLMGDKYLLELSFQDQLKDSLKQLLTC